MTTFERNIQQYSQKEQSPHTKKFPLKMFSAIVNKLQFPMALKCGKRKSMGQKCQDEMKWTSLQLLPITST